MQTVRQIDRVPEEARGAAVAIGNFDGVHRGHREVVAVAARAAREHGVRLGVVTFEPHPRSVFRPDLAPFRLTPAPAKARELAELGVEVLFELPFDLGFAAQTAEAFVDDLLVGALGVRHVVVGYDFCFGHARRGSPAMLRQLGPTRGFAVSEVAPVAGADTPVVSSTLIRECLERGDVRGAARLLGRAWEIEGVVEAGDQRGRTIGFPTANVALGEHLRPATGVYAVRVGRPGGDWLPAVANFGLRPTVRGTVPKLEAHLFDFAGDLYGETLRVAFVERIREERAFPGLDALKAQIAADAETARRMLSDA